MKFIVNNHFTKQSQRIISALVLTGILSLSGGLILLQAATAAPKSLSQQAAKGEILKSEDKLTSEYEDDDEHHNRHSDDDERNGDRTNELPDAVANAVRQDLSRKVNIPPGKLQIVNYSQKTWSNGCLGLARSDEFCTQALVPGWRVVVSDGSQNWVYRSDRTGQILRLETQNTSSDAGIGAPMQIPTSELPPRLQLGVVFRAIASGGFAGRTYQTTLTNDGRVIRVLLNSSNATSQPQIHQVSQQQVQQFQQLLEQQQFAQFNHLSYPAPRGAADYITVTLTSPGATIRYIDINQDRLPTSLQNVIQAWNQIIQS